MPPTGAVPEDPTTPRYAYDAYHPSMPLRFTDPAVGLGAHSRPQLRTPILTDAIELEHLGRVRAVAPDRGARLNEIRLAQLAIEAKAKTLPWIGAATSEFDAVGAGFIIRYENADIYYSAETGAHEV